MSEEDQTNQGPKHRVYFQHPDGFCRVREVLRAAENVVDDKLIARRLYHEGRIGSTDLTPRLDSISLYGTGVDVLLAYTASGHVLDNPESSHVPFVPGRSKRRSCSFAYALEFDRREPTLDERRIAGRPLWLAGASSEDCVSEFILLAGILTRDDALKMAAELATDFGNSHVHTYEKVAFGATNLFAPGVAIGGLEQLADIVPVPLSISQPSVSTTQLPYATVTAQATRR